MKIKLSNAKPILTAIFVFMTHSALSQTNAEFLPPRYDEASFKGVQLTILIDTNLITDSSTNILRCRLTNGATNAILWFKRWGSVVFENNKNRKVYYLPVYEAPSMVLETNHLAHFKIVETKVIKVGESFEWTGYFSIGHPFDPVKALNRDATNENAKSNYENLKSSIYIKEHGIYRVRISQHIRTPKDANERIDWDLHSNQLELKVGD